MANYTVDFGSAQTGLATVGYEQKKADGSTAVARTTTGVVAFGNGVYGVTVTPDAQATVITWDTGTDTPLYASEDIAYPTPEQIAAAILAAAQITPIHSNIKKVNDVTVTGTGALGNEWGPA